jgi:hypothetical protein
MQKNSDHTSKSSLVTPIISFLYENNLKKRMFDTILHEIMKHAVKDNASANITSAHFRKQQRDIC